MPERSRISPMKVKNGIASSMSLFMIAVDALGQRRRKSGRNSPSSMPIRPKIRPLAASENATG